MIQHYEFLSTYLRLRSFSIFLLWPLSFTSQAKSDLAYGNCFSNTAMNRSKSDHHGLSPHPAHHRSHIVQDRNVPWIPPNHWKSHPKADKSLRVPNTGCHTPIEAQSGSSLTHSRGGRHQANPRAQSENSKSSTPAVTYKDRRDNSRPDRGSTSFGGSLRVAFDIRQNASQNRQQTGQKNRHPKDRNVVRRAEAQPLMRDAKTKVPRSQKASGFGSGHPSLLVDDIPAPLRTANLCLPSMSVSGPHQMQHHPQSSAHKMTQKQPIHRIAPLGRMAPSQEELRGQELSFDLERGICLPAGTQLPTHVRVRIAAEQQPSSSLQLSHLDPELYPDALFPKDFSSFATELKSQSLSVPNPAVGPNVKQELSQTTGSPCRQSFIDPVSARIVGSSTSHELEKMSHIQWADMQTDSDKAVTASLRSSREGEDSDWVADFDITEVEQTDDAEWIILDK